MMIIHTYPQCPVFLVYEYDGTSPRATGGLDYTLILHLHQLTKNLLTHSERNSPHRLLPWNGIPCVNVHCRLLSLSSFALHQTENMVVFAQQGDQPIFQSVGYVTQFISQLVD